jgi:hypothetical protein
MRALAFVVVAACGYPPLDSGNPDAHGTDSHNPDGSSGCQAAASYGPITPSNPSGDYFPANARDPDEVDYAGALNATDVLSLSFFDDQPPFQSGFKTGTFDLAGETEFKSCGTCVLIAAHCSNCDLTTGAGVGSWYMAMGGTLKLTTLTTTSVAGTLTDATLMHVAINFTTGDTTPASDACTTQIAAATFSATLTQH